MTLSLTLLHFPSLFTNMIITACDHIIKCGSDWTWKHHMTVQVTENKKWHPLPPQLMIYVVKRTFQHIAPSWVQSSEPHSLLCHRRSDALLLLLEIGVSKRCITGTEEFDDRKRSASWHYTSYYATRRRGTQEHQTSGLVFLLETKRHACVESASWALELAP